MYVGLYPTGRVHIRKFDVEFNTSAGLSWINPRNFTMYAVPNWIRMHCAIAQPLPVLVRGDVKDKFVHEGVQDDCDRSSTAVILVSYGTSSDPT